MITQDDSMVIPDNVVKIVDAGFVDLLAVVVVDGAASVRRRKWDLLLGFGVLQTCALAARMLQRRVAIWLGLRQDLKGAARHARADFRRTDNLHQPSVLAYLEQLKPDVIASYSAPTVFKESVLRIPRLGCVNLHCSLLPKYAGLLPSFWVLFNGETIAGASVHFMDDRIDNGAILGQCRVAVPERASMYDLLRLTKDAGGDLMVRVLGELRDGTASPAPNRAEEGSYHKWPTVSQLREFRRRGGRLA